MSFRPAITLASTLLLAACASTPGIPDTVYHRLPAPGATTSLVEPFTRPILVEAFRADGIHIDQALVYSLEADARELRTYHYQLWAEPPSRLLQQRLINVLRTARAADIVTDRLAAHADALRVEGRIEAFERIQRGAGWEVAVSLELRVDSGATQPLLLRHYRETRPAAGTAIADSTRAMGEALDAAFARFLTDLDATRER